MEEKKDYELITKDQQTIIFIITRIINVIAVMLYIFFFLTICIRPIERSFALEINIQICISQFFYNLINCFPIINTEELEQSWMCPIQTILANLSFSSTACLVFIFLLIAYITFFHKNFSKNFNLKFKVVLYGCNWLISLCFALCFLLTDIKSGVQGICRGSSLFAKCLLGGFCLIIAIVSNILICILVNGMKRLSKNYSFNFWSRYIKKLLWYNLPIILGGVAFVIKFMRGLANSHFIYILFAEIFQNLVSISLTLIYCYNEKVRTEMKNLICCVKAPESISRTSQVCMVTTTDEDSIYISS